MAEIPYVEGVGAYKLTPAGPIPGTSVLSAAAANTYGSWVEFIASAPEDLFLTHIISYPAVTETLYSQIAIGFGASGSEVIIGEFKIILQLVGTSALITGPNVPISPPIKIPTGTRVAIKVADINLLPRSHLITIGYCPASRVTVPFAEQVLNYQPEGAHTFKNILRLISAVLFGKASGGGTTEIKFRDLGDTKDRITATVDTNGNRTAVTLDGT